MDEKITASLLSFTFLFWGCTTRASVNEPLDQVLLDTLRKFEYVSDEDQYGEDRKISFAKQVKEGKTFANRGRVSGSFQIKQHDM